MHRLPSDKIAGSDGLVQPVSSGKKKSVLCPVHPSVAPLCTLSTRTAGVQLAVSTLKDQVKGSRVTEVAVPYNQGAVRLDHLEGVGTGSLNGHRVEID